MRKILHISDVHFGPPHRPAAAEGVATLVAERSPDLVVLSGDLTQRAKPRQFRQAREFVDRLAAPVVAVPGNHDVPLYRVWERLPNPYGAYRGNFAPELEPHFEDEELVAVGVNTAHGWTLTNGRFRARRLEEVARLLAAAGERFKVVVAHHNLLPPPRRDRPRPPRNARRAARLFARAGVDLVLSGHQHQAYFGDAANFFPGVDGPLWVVHSGTTTSSRGRAAEREVSTCNWIELGRREIALTVCRWSEDEGRFEEVSHHRLPRPGGARDGEAAGVAGGVPADPSAGGQGL